MTKLADTLAIPTLDSVVDPETRRALEEVREALREIARNTVTYAELERAGIARYVNGRLEKL